MIAEVQQSSDTTYRLFDWNRVGPDGKPRQLHISQALDVIDFHQGPVDPVQPIPIDGPGVNRLVACDKFVLDRLELSAARRPANATAAISCLCWTVRSTLPAIRADGP